MLGGLLKCPKTPHNHYGTLSWGPEGTLGPAKSNFFQNPNFHRFPAKFALPNAHAGARSVFLRPQNPPAGVPAGKQVLGCRLQCPRTPQGQYGTPPWGPLGTLGLAKSKKIAIFGHFRGPEKNTSASNPRRPENRIKSEIPPKLGCFIETFLCGTPHQSTLANQ